MQTDGWNKILAEPFMPFCAASVMACVQDVPAVMAMNTSGSLEASVVISLVMFGARRLDRLELVVDVVLSTVP